MSIFKNSFKRYVVRQIKARQDLLNTQGKRPIQFQQYVSSKSSWIKMTSFVDYDPNYKTEDVNYSPNYSSNLAKKYVLFGGSLKIDPNDDKRFTLRRGIADGTNKNAVYGSTDWSREYGLVPMPGIKKIEIKNKSAYGSLREATITYYAWDKKQLEELEILYMRPFYPILLEWGWSVFLNTFDQKEDITEYAINEHNLTNIQTPNIKINPGNDMTTINIFNNNMSQLEIYDKIDLNKRKYCGNYDGMLGFVKNFTRRLLPNGGYECTTVLISIGEVIESLRMNTATGYPDSNEAQNVPKKDNFEVLMNKLAFGSHENNTVIKQINDNIPEKYKNVIDTDIYTINNSVNITSVEPSVGGTTKEARKDLVGYNYITGFLAPKKTDNTKGEDSGNTLNVEGFIQLGYFLHILDEYNNLYSEKQEKMYSIELPFYSSNLKDPLSKNKGNGLCVAGQNSISIDPLSCIIKNEISTIFQSPIPSLKGYSYDTYKKISDKTKEGGTRQQIKNFLVDFKSKNNIIYYCGVIGNIYVSLHRIMDIYKDLIKNSGVSDVLTLIKAVLADCSYALGGINDFDVYTEDSKIVIIDKHYVEYPENSYASKKYKINLNGTNSIVRTHNVQTQIFASQANMFAVAAQDRENVTSVESSTMAYLNKGLRSRIMSSKVEYDNKNGISEKNEREKIKTNDIILKLKSIVENYFLKGVVTLDYNDNIKPSAYSWLNSLLVKVDQTTNYKGIIPINLEITVDGISGMVVGEIFTVNSDVLPKEYENKNVGFIITGLSNNIENGDWTTTISTQVCLLDQFKLSENITALSKTTKKELQNQIIENTKISKSSVTYYNILVAFIADFYNSTIYIAGNNSINNMRYFREKIFNIGEVASSDKAEPSLLQSTIISENFSDTSYGSTLETVYFYFSQALTYGINSDPKSIASEAPFKKSLGIDQKIDLTSKDQIYANIPPGYYNLLLDFPQKTDLFGTKIYNESEIESFRSNILSYIIKNNYFYTNLDFNLKTFFDENFVIMQKAISQQNRFYFPTILINLVTDGVTGKIKQRSRFPKNFPNIAINSYKISYTNFISTPNAVPGKYNRGLTKYYRKSV
jgi:hypothetical protein